MHPTHARRLAVATIVCLAGAAVPVVAGAKPASEQLSNKRVVKTQTTTRKCRSSKSKAVRSIRRQTLADGTVRTTTRYCNGNVRVVERRTKTKTKTVTKTTPGPTQTVPGPPTPVPGPTQTVEVPGPTQTVTTTTTVEVPPPPPPARPMVLTLLHNNDGESKVLTGDSITSYGGAAAYRTRLEQLRAQAASDAAADPQVASGAKAAGTINVSSGDNFLAGLNYQGSVARGRFYDADVVDALDYDAVTIGNHEFDFGPERLADFIEDSGGTTFISANLDLSGVPRLDALADEGQVRKSVVVSRDGEEVGIIGLTTPTITNISTVTGPTGTVGVSPDVGSLNATQVEDALAAIVQAEVAALKAQGVNKIVLSSHLQGLASEQSLATKLTDVDVIIAGGGDELLINAGQAKVNADPAAGPYPTTATDAAGKTVRLVTTQGEYRYVGRLVVEFDADGDVVSTVASSGPVRVSAKAGDPDEVAKDPTIVRQVDTPLTAYRAAQDANFIAKSEVGLDGRNSSGSTIRRRETNLGNLVADAFLYVGRRDAALNGRSVPQVALANGGGIRNSSVLLGCGASPAGPLNIDYPLASGNSISVGDTFRILPFDNTMVRIQLTRQRLREVLEAGYRNVGSASANGAFIHVAGMRVVVDGTGTAQTTSGTVPNVTVATPGTKVTEVRLMESDGSPGAFVVQNGAVVPGDDVVAIMTEFGARGGDSYPTAGQGYQNLSPSIGYQQALARYLSEPAAGGGLGGIVGGSLNPAPVVTAAAYPFGGVDRITISGRNAADPDAYPACT